MEGDQEEPLTPPHLPARPHVQQAPNLPPQLPPRPIQKLHELFDEPVGTTIDTNRPAGADYEFYKAVQLGEGDGAIRLLNLLPGQFDAPILCTLEIANISDSPEYEALSYNWGSDEILHKIRVNGSALYVTPNLFTALKYLRYTDAPRRLWIDKICINQALNSERAEQVAIMTQIYSAATQTIAWLGDDFPGSAEIKDFFKNSCYNEKFERLRDSVPSNEKSSVGWIKRNIDAIKQKYREIDLIMVKKLCETLAKTLSAPYFTRAWILQEIAVSETVILQCGRTMVVLSNFLRSFRTWRSIRLSTQALGDKDEAGLWYIRGLAVEVLQDLHKQSESLTLCSHLSRYRLFETGRPEDKIYALYGLAKHNVETLELKIDYNRPAAELYIDTAFILLDRLNEMSILEMPRGNAGLRPQLPSWVPDWSDCSKLAIGLTPESQALRKEIRSTHPLHLTGSSDLQLATDEHRLAVQRFNASKYAQPAPVTLWEGNTLCITAMPFDKINEVSAKFYGIIRDDTYSLDLDSKEDNTDSFKEFMKEMIVGQIRDHIIVLGDAHQNMLDTWDELLALRQRFAGATSGSYVAGGSFSEAFLRTLCTNSLPAHLTTADMADISELFDGLSSSYYRSRKWADIYRGWFSGRSKETQDAITAWLRSEKTLDIRTADGRAAFRLLEVLGPIVKRRFAITQRGYFCLVPADALAGDDLIIPKGGALPLVVRQRLEGYTLLGESYVHGIMQGEAWNESLCEEYAIK